MRLSGMTWKIVEWILSYDDLMRNRMISDRTMIIHTEYFLDGTGPPITVPGTHEEFFNITFGIWLGVKSF